MDPISAQSVLATAGAAAAGEATYVDDVFSTYLYTGNISTNVINNGIDLSGEGGLVWIKNRDYFFSHILVDTERGATKYLNSNQPYAEGTAPNTVPSFSSTGFTVGTDNQVNYNASGQNQYVSWTFRKAPGFFDVVTYSGNGSTQTISHNLGSVPGCIIVKRTDSSRDWAVYHRSLGNSQALKLNDDSAARSFNGWGNTTPTATAFYLGADSDTNNSSGTYVAYLFAHDEQSFGTDSDEAIIKCGSYTGSGSSETTVDLGFEPQWVMIKRTTGSSVDWVLYDNMRGVPSGTGDMQLAPSQSAAETDQNRIDFYSQGFKLQNDAAHTNHSGITYIYMAIRRPHKPPEAATDVFTADNHATDSSAPFYRTSGHVSDLAIAILTQSNNVNVISRLTGKEYLVSHSTAASASNQYYVWDYMNGMNSYTASSDQAYNHISFKRAPGFLDVVTYTGNGANGHDISHNLEAVPQLMIVKKRSESSYSDWTVYYKSATAGGANKYLYLNSDSGETTHSTIPWNNTEPTATQFTVYNSWIVNRSGHTYIAYLFATLDGISKVGTYSGTGNAINVNCGFTNGARFVLIKRTDSSGDWYIWDTTRGIVSGNDPYTLLNLSAAEVTNTDYIDPLNAGFTVTSSAPAALNTSGGTYLFLAIA